MNLKRYEIAWSNVEGEVMRECPHGEYVKHEDVEKYVKNQGLNYFSIPSEGCVGVMGSKAQFDELIHKAALADAHLPKTADGAFVCECKAFYCPLCNEEVYNFDSVKLKKICRKCDVVLNSNLVLASPRKEGA